MVGLVPRASWPSVSTDRLWPKSPAFEFMLVFRRGCSRGKAQLRSPAFPDIGCRRRVLTLTAAQFPNAFGVDHSVTQAAYAKDPLFKLHGVRKGRVLQQAVWWTLATTSPCTSLMKPPLGRCANGARRGDNQGEFDFAYGKRRVECKGASMAWVAANRCWSVTWCKIKFRKAFFDDLFLALHSPGYVDIVLHDGVTGITEAGVKTAFLGHNVRVKAAQGCHDAGEACKQILGKLLSSQNGCRHVASLRSDSGHIAELISQELSTESCRLSTFWYKGVPLAQLSASSRGLRLQDMAVAVDQMLHPNSVFRHEVDSSEMVGALQTQRRGKSRGSADWLRDTIRVEFKSSMLTWHSTHQRWRAQFSCVKFISRVGSRVGVCSDALFDELWLGLYCPFGLYLVQYVGEVGRSRTGVATDDLGHNVAVSGPRREECPRIAIEAILTKLEESGCKLLAILTW